MARTKKSKNTPLWDLKKKVIDYGPPYTMANPNNHIERSVVDRRWPEDRRKAYNIHDKTESEDTSAMLKVSHLLEEITSILGNHNESLRIMDLTINTEVLKQIKTIKNDICKMADEMDKLKQADINLKYLIGKTEESVVNSAKDN